MTNPIRRVLLASPLGELVKLEIHDVRCLVTNDTLTQWVWLGMDRSEVKAR